MEDAPKLLGTDTLRQAYPKFNQAIDNANEALTKASTAEANSSNALSTANSVQSQFNQVVIEGDSSVEAAQARVDADGTTFTTLKERIDNEQSKRKLQKYFTSVEEFGAKGDGVTDDYTAIKNAITSLKTSGGGKLVFSPGKVYKCNSPLGLFEASNITIDFQGATLDFSSVAANVASDLIGFKGTYSTGVSLTVDATKSTRIVQVDTTGFAVGDMVRVYSNTIWDANRTSTKIGEIAFVESINSVAQLTLTTPLFDTYLVSASAKIEKLTPVENIHIRNGKIMGSAGNDEHYGIHIQLGRSCLIENMNTYRVDKRHIVLTDCIDSNVENCTIKVANHTSQAYGISFVDATRDCVARGNHFTHIRHALSTNNNVGWSWGIVRNLLWDGNTVLETSNDLSGGYGDAIDTHAGCEFLTIVNNVVNGCNGSGINIEGKSAIVANNRIMNVGMAGIYLRPYPDSPSQFIVTGNEITLGIGDSSGASDYGIYFLADMADCEYLEVANNTVESQVSPIWLGGSTKKINKAVISGNATKTLRAGSSITLNNALLGAISGNAMESLTTGIYLSTLSGVSVTGNSVRIRGTGSTGYGVFFNGTNESIVVSGNSLRNEGTITSSVGVALSSTTTYSGVFGNVTRGFNTIVTLSTGTGNQQANNI